MPTPSSSWQDAISPDDPRYESWLLLRAFLQSEDSGAQAEFLSTFQKNGTIELEDVLKFVSRLFDGRAKALAITVTGTLSAERRARDLDECLGKCLEELKNSLPAVEAFTGIAADSLEIEARLRLTTRSEAWKAEAFRIGLENEISRIRESSQTSQPSVSPAETTGPTGASLSGAGPAIPAQARSQQVPCEGELARPEEAQEKRPGSTNLTSPHEPAGSLKGTTLLDLAATAGSGPPTNISQAGAETDLSLAVSGASTINTASELSARSFEGVKSTKNSVSPSSLARNSLASSSPPASPPRRTPDLESSRKRIELVKKLAQELATIKPELSRFCTPSELKGKYPNLSLWDHLQAAELKELTDGVAFTPRAYAENLTLRKFGITSRETLKKDRQKLRKAEKTDLA
jgi:hypothetical protein